MNLLLAAEPAATVGITAHDILFCVFGLTAVLGAVAVVVSANVVRMAFWLIVSLGASSGLFFLLHADFLGAAQLLVYVGGTLVLLVFGVMLTASGPFVSMRTNPGEAVMSAVVGAALLGLILYTAGSVEWTKVAPPPAHSVAATRGSTTNPPVGYYPAEQGNTTRPLGFSLLGYRPDKDLSKDLSGARPNLSAGYLLPFEIISVHLLVVLVGAAYLARAKRRRDQATPGATL